MLIDTGKYSQSLKKLWSEVFGDSDEYISLIFDKGYIPAEVFGEIVDGDVVSALYLLRCNITTDSESYSGRYLYAAATLSDHRKKGIMGRLINEAKEYAEKDNINFIALVPASEKLYGYYTKHGFEPLMYKYVSVAADIGLIEVEDEKIDDICFFEMRNCLSGTRFSFEIPEIKYALSCLDFAGYGVYRNSSDSYYISDKDRTEIIEYVSSEDNFAENTSLFLSKLGAGVEISSPYDLSKFCKCKRQKFGMVFTENNVLKTKIVNGIYMNIALD